MFIYKACRNHIVQVTFSFFTVKWTDDQEMKHKNIVFFLNVCFVMVLYVFLCRSVCKFLYGTTGHFVMVLLKMLGLYLYPLIIGHKSCNILSILNKLKL